MTAFIRDLIFIPKTIFPGHLPLPRALYVLVIAAFIVPLYKLHIHQTSGPRQPHQTAWMKSISKLLVQAFHPEQMDPELWLDEGPGAVYAENMANESGTGHR
jgi:hypothetical protein